jgi:RNA polymerase sigma-70 factor (ECF subfamily)
MKSQGRQSRAGSPKAPRKANLAARPVAAAKRRLPGKHLEAMDEAESLRTRASLIARMKNHEDDTSWNDFFDTYWKLIYGVARKAGLSNDEAQDAVQETLASVARHIPDFKYSATRGSFKAWLLNLTRWRIVDQMRKRGPRQAYNGPHSSTEPSTELLHTIPDPASLVTEHAWHLDWQRNLVEAALARLRPRVDPRNYQLFDFYVNKDWPPEKVAERFGVNIDQVYLAKHRVTVLLKAEIRRLEIETI